MNEEAFGLREALQSLEHAQKESGEASAERIEALEGELVVARQSLSNAGQVS